MADAEIIPLGGRTRSGPGGTTPGAEPPPESADPAGAEGPVTEPVDLRRRVAGHAVGSPDAESVGAEDAGSVEGSDGYSDASPVEDLEAPAQPPLTGRPTVPGVRLQLAQLLSAVTSAAAEAATEVATELLAEDAERRLAEAMEFVRRRVTGEYEV